jgi:hypothetical protein
LRPFRAVALRNGVRHVIERILRLWQPSHRTRRHREKLVTMRCAQRKSRQRCVWWCQEIDRFLARANEGRKTNRTGIGGEFNQRIEGTSVFSPFDLEGGIRELVNS